MVLAPPIVFGEVLLDCFPDGREVLGGAPFNVAWNLQAFGLSPLFISRIGDDPQGQLIRSTMTSWSMNSAYLQLDPTRPTGRVKITLNRDEPHFTIIQDQAYDHISNPIPQIGHDPAFLYHGTLALRDMSNRATLEVLKQQYPCPVFLDVNLREPWWDKETVLSLLPDATWLKLNEDEFQTLFPDQGEPAASGRPLLDLYDLEAIFITRGKKGAVTITRDSQVETVEPSGPINIVDTVGAGDAFSSVLLLGLIKNWPIALCMERAQDFASGVVGLRGAIDLDPGFYSSYSRKWGM